MPNPVELVGGLAIGEGVGTAIADVVKPQLEEFRTDQWAKHLHVPLPGELVAELITRSISVQGFDSDAEYARNGLSGPRRTVLEQLARKYPGLADALMLWRRGYANYGNVFGWLNRAGLSDELVRQMIGDGSVTPAPGNSAGRLFMERLTPAQVALGVVRSIIDDPGLMPVQLDTAGGAVAAYPASSINALTEALDSGVNREHLRVLVGEIGLPMSPQQAASALFRKLVLPNGKTFARPDYYRAILEGDTRPEWADAILEQARQILTPGQYAELQLRGFLNADERRAHTDKHGMSHADSNLLYDVLGRAPNVHALRTGIARGGAYPGNYANVPEPYRSAIQRGNLREEFSEIAYANLYSYPSFFAIRALMQARVFSADEGHQILLEMGWKPDLARKVADFYGASATVTADPHVAKAQTQLWNTTHRSYIAAESDDAAATPALEAAGVATGAVAQVLELWKAERALIRKQLTPTNIKKAYLAPSRNYATGANWTRDDAIAALVQRGYSVTEANDFLDIPSR